MTMTKEEILALLQKIKESTKGVISNESTRNVE